MFSLNGLGLYIGENAEKVVNTSNHVVITEITNIEKYLEECIFDFIYLDDILQKLEKVDNIIKLSFQGLKKNGFLLVKVPDFNLYEKYLWPSVFMLDHKLSFSNDVKRSDLNRETHYHIDDLKRLSESFGFSNIESFLDDTNFDYERPLLENQTKIGASCHLYFKFYK